ncbi:MAG TPA: diaminohydroxyphosphoribosylaminopyrimidine deaminase [Leptospiraceae bacterium]|nr:diaminohydroxyphosphoribosylaminopyrimidine deaminase [Spirochaetaceae bacterium]HBS04097.1 diaminohydroxyphosphoribosylaminopyrimidine deaminase [Leptospiraceae bacterium]|tara:strand:+ start:57710 stop:58747 length:1038 start_codon:yes stop_codon:yes gene_type:complete
MGKTVLVTGGSGYIASWIVKYLLEEGHNVHATVRSLKSEDKVAHLRGLEKLPGSLTLFEADLLSEGSFDQAMKGCEIVMHTASPFFIKGLKDAQKQLIDPALKGTRNVLETVNRHPEVKRVVLTSSVAAIMGDNVDALAKDNQTMDENDWNRSSSLDHQPYSYSKTVAEEEAWRIAKSQDHWKLVVINPAFVMGPSLSKRMDGTSVQFVRDLVGGPLKSGVPDLTFGIVDVRDVARAHVLAAFKEDASGRHILCADTKTFVELADLLRERYGKTLPLPRGQLPGFMVYLIGPFFGLSWGFLKKNLGVRYNLDHSRSIEDLGIAYRPIADTLCDHVDQLKEAGIVG